jgi:hypothetical protein
MTKEYKEVEQERNSLSYSKKIVIAWINIVKIVS